MDTKMDVVTATTLVKDAILTFLDFKQPFYQEPFTKELDLNYYTVDKRYANYSWSWHLDNGLRNNYLNFICDQMVSGQTLLDAGCGMGMTGLVIGLMTGAMISFHDFGGLGKQFITKFAQDHDMTVAYYPYGVWVTEHDWVLAMDVLEHTHNHLACLRWLEMLGTRVGLCYPVSAKFAPPYVDQVDEWVDDLALIQTIASRHELRHAILREGRRYILYSKFEKREI